MLIGLEAATVLQGEKEILEAAFELQGVGYRQIIEIDELKIPCPSIYCIAGESGSGKSTLLKLLNNMLSCDRGRIYLFGRNIMEINPVVLRRRVVMVPQNPAVFPGTVLENLQKALHFAQKAPPGQEQLEELLSALRLPEMSGRDVSALSGGEKQRLALARGMLLEPEVLLLDEPSSALDEGTEQAVLGYIVRKIRQEQKTAVVVTHSRDLALSFGDSVLTLCGGKVKQLKQLKQRRLL